MNIYILEDEPLNLSMITAMIEHNFDDIKIVGTSDSIDRFNQEYKSLDIDLALLDINIQGEKIFDSFDFEKVKFGVVFITAYPEYAIDAIKAKAFDYLTKPINEEQLCTVLTEFQYNLNRLATSIDKFQINRLFISSIDGYKLIKLSDVAYLEADKTNSIVHFSNGTKLIATKSLLFFETSLANCHFYRVHHAYLINLLSVTHYDKKDGDITFSNGELLKVSARKKPEFLRIITTYT